MKAREMMNACVVELGPTDSVELAACAMRDERVGLVCVCDPDRRPLGIVTDRDLAIRVCAPALPARETKLEAVMTHAPLTCGLDAPASEVEALMAERGVSKVLVVDADGRLAGALTLAEICHHESPLIAGHLVRRVIQGQIRVQTGSSGQHASLPPRLPTTH